jgi:hypothetical protein
MRASIASVTAFGEPGRQKIAVFPIMPLVARVSMAEEPIFS